MANNNDRFLNAYNRLDYYLKSIVNVSERNLIYHEVAKKVQEVVKTDKCASPISFPRNSSSSKKKKKKHPAPP